MLFRSRSHLGSVRLLCALALAVCFFVPRISAQEVAKRFTNQDVIDMTALALSDDVIIAKIRSESSAGALKFDTSVEGLKALKAAKVSDEEIKVMLNPAPAPAAV